MKSEKRIKVCGKMGYGFGALRVWNGRKGVSVEAPRCEGTFSPPWGIKRAASGGRYSLSTNGRPNHMPKVGNPTSIPTSTTTTSNKSLL